DEVVDLGAARLALAERGLTRLVCEGGPTLFAGLAQAGLVEELCLTVSPQLAGPGAGRLGCGPGRPLALSGVSHQGRRGRAAGLLVEDEALFGRYRLVR